MKPGKSTKNGQKRSSSRRSSTSPSVLDRMISDAIVDCYDDSEQAMCLFTMIDEKLRLPFSTISVVDLPLPSVRPVGAE